MSQLKASLYEGVFVNTLNKSKQIIEIISLTCYPKP